MSVSAVERSDRDSSFRELVTPEGVLLPVRLAERGERAAAVLVDLMIIFGAIFVLVLLFAFSALGGSLSGWQFSFGVLLSFFVRSFYFIFFELRWQGSTPGKRIFGVRVIDRGGGRLRPDAIFARNLMREVEIFLPAGLLLQRDALGIEGLGVLLTFVWMSIFALLPFFNKDRLRAGDIVGGTWVVAAPKAALLPDMAEASATPRPGLRSSGAGPQFSTKQLEAYGIYELQTLEKVLREQGPKANAMRKAVCGRIQRKIGWRSTEPVDTRRFLEAFYSALRAHLEAKMLLGVRRRDKFDRSDTPPK